IVGFSIGLIPQIRKALIGDGAPLRVVQDTASLLGDGAIPILTLIIGGNLLKGLRGPGMQKSLVVGIIIVRYVALPLIGILVIKGALKLGLVHSDPLYLFVLLLQFSLPPAMNIGMLRSSDVIFPSNFCNANYNLPHWLFLIINRHSFS
ncbi:PREDICTED: PIN-LIKES, partial [Prunus dulcis]